VPQYDDYVVVLDFLRHGKPGDRKAEPTAQCIGDKFFTLLEVVTREGLEIKPGDRLYVGAAKRYEVKYVRDRITLDQLTTFARAEVEDVVMRLVTKGEERFVKFFNEAGPLSTRLHTLELLPGIGKKHLWVILTERKKRPFDSFKDIQKRVPMLPDVRRMITKRILRELEKEERHRLFTAAREREIPPPRRFVPTP
jgi:putative nucleotide binding protein